jgi:hypothetical protein
VNIRPTWESLQEPSYSEETGQSIQPVLERLFDNYFGIWATQRIICVGDYATKPPPALEDVQQRLCNFDLPEIFGLHQHLHRIRKPLNNEFKKTFDDIYLQLQTDHFPAHQQCVLLNFTAKEYVLDRFRNTNIGIGLAYKRESQIWGLGDVVLSKICWSQDSSISMDYHLDVEGNWAGHGFAIIALLVFDEMTGGRDGWQDATNEAWEELDAIWRAEGLR